MSELETALRKLITEIVTEILEKNEVTSDEVTPKSKAKINEEKEITETITQPSVNNEVKFKLGDTRNDFDERYIKLSGELSNLGCFKDKASREKAKEVLRKYIDPAYHEAPALLVYVDESAFDFVIKDLKSIFAGK